MTMKQGKLAGSWCAVSLAYLGSLPTTTHAEASEVSFARIQNPEADT